jgi:CNT family concentrative nucleoside transporter
LRTTVGIKVVDFIARHVQHLHECAEEGIRFVFGNLVDDTGSWGFVFGFQVLPVIIFFGAFMAVLFYFGIVQKMVSGVNYVLSPLLKTSGAETLCAIANSFLGQTDAPLLVRHYLNGMTKSEMMVVMVSGMATISGAILVAFVKMGVPPHHLLASSVMSIPASIIIAKILYPETEKSHSHDDATSISQQALGSNLFDAIAKGTMDGVQLAVGVGAMLISFLALLTVANCFLAYISELVNQGLAFLNSGWQIPTVSIDYILSYIFAPFGYLLGFDGDEIFAAGRLIGTKIALNEAIAYSKMVALDLSERTKYILTYALCGFSNLSCIGIQIGGIGALVPDKRQWLTELGLYALLGGTLSNLLCAMIAGLLL